MQEEIQKESAQIYQVDCAHTQESEKEVLKKSKVSKERVFWRALSVYFTSIAQSEVKRLVKGTVKRWLDLRGYGFISSEEFDKDVFVHSSDIQGKSSLNEGEEVEFEVESSHKGQRAVKVKPVSK